MVILVIIAARLSRRRTRAAQDQVLRERERAHVTLASIGDAVITLSADARIEYMNASAEKMAGRTIDICRGEFFQAIFVPSQPQPDNPLERAIRDCEIALEIIRCTTPITIRNPDGNEITLVEYPAAQSGTAA